MFIIASVPKKEINKLIKEIEKYCYKMLQLNTEDSAFSNIKEVNGLIEIEKKIQIRVKTV